jgi:hypothetical protein
MERSSSPEKTFMLYDIKGAAEILARTPRRLRRVATEAHPMGTVDNVMTLVEALEKAAIRAGCVVDRPSKGHLSIAHNIGDSALVAVHAFGETADLTVVGWSDRPERPDIEWKRDRFVGPYEEENRAKRDALHELAELVSHAMTGETTRR